MPSAIVRISYRRSKYQGFGRNNLLNLKIIDIYGKDKLLYVFNSDDTIYCYFLRNDGDQANDKIRDNFYDKELETVGTIEIDAYIP